MGKLWLNTASCFKRPSNLKTRGKCSNRSRHSYTLALFSRPCSRSLATRLGSLQCRPLTRRSQPPRRKPRLIELAWRDIVGGWDHHACFSVVLVLVPQWRSRLASLFRAWLSQGLAQVCLESTDPFWGI